MGEQQGAVKLLRLVRLARLAKLIKNSSAANDYHGVGWWNGIHWIHYVVAHDCPILIWHNWQYAFWSKRSMALWRSVMRALMTLFRASTLEDWTDIKYINYFGCDSPYYDSGIYHLNDPYQSPPIERSGLLLGRWLSGYLSL